MDPLQVMDIINEEEKQFLKTLSRGKRLFERTINKLEGTDIPGRSLVAWGGYYGVGGIFY